MKIALGTVQFGMSYGIANKLGEVGSPEIERILQYADRNGVEILDVASSYGNAESAIGKFISNQVRSKQWKVITKTPHFKSDIIDQQVDELLESFKLSLKKLGQKSIYGLLIHNCDDIFLSGGEKLLQIMDKLKQDGLIEKIGVSLYSGEQISSLLDNYLVDIVQLPINILDQRLLEGGQLSMLKKYGVEIHARSVFLQGLLLMPIDTIPSWFNPIKDTLKLFHEEAKKQNLTKLQLALGFVQSLIEIDKVVVGVNSLGQLHEIVSASSVRVNTAELSNISINNPIFLNPSKWKV
jgi:aryl-alcohol dehydrogenase-like predicted oxidoreductase